MWLLLLRGLNSDVGHAIVINQKYFEKFIVCVNKVYHRTALIALLLSIKRRK